MHEMGIANSVLEAVRTEVSRYPGARPARVGVRIGEWSGVDTESLRFCFDALVAGSDLAGLQLDLDYRPRRNACGQCDAEFAVVEYETRCPNCASEATKMISGTELDIAYLELEE